MQKKIGLLLFIIGVVIYTHAQNQNRFRVGVGYQRTWMLDKQASPLKYQSSEKTLLLGYQYAGEKALFNAQLEGAFGDFFPTGFRNRSWYRSGYNPDGVPKKDSNLLIGALYQARVRVGYGRAISTGYTKIGNQDFHSIRYLGASLSNQLFYSDNIVRNGWLNSTSLNGDFTYIIQEPRHWVTVRLSIPLFARNTRLPYHNTVSSAEGDGNVKTVLKQGSRIAWLGNFQNAQLDASYQYAVSRRVGIGVHYSGQWLRYSHEKTVTLFKNNIGLLASFK